MFKNYFTIALRNFRRNKLFSLINILGLAIGISAALVIYLLVQYEFSFERSQEDNKRIYRVVSDMQFPGQLFRNSGVPLPMPAAMRSDMTGIETVSQFVTASDSKVSVPFPGNQSPAEFKKEGKIIYADENYFSLFQYDWLAGSEKVALKDPFKLVLTENRAKTYFGNTAFNDIIGRTVIFDDSIKTTVVGIVKDKDLATDFTFKEFISFATVTETGLKNHFGYGEWGSINSSSQVFVKLSEGTTTKQVEAQFPGLRKKYRKEDKDGKDDTYNHLQVLTNIHFNNDYDAFGQRQAHKPTLYGLLAVALFLLLLGCINFINLTTAQSTQRAKEIGIRKTMGSSKKQLVTQFLSETFILTLLATILSIAIMPWILKVFKDFIPSEISFASIDQPHVWIFLVLLVILVSILSGIYPALVLTRFKPVTVLKNQAYAGTSKTRKVWLRKTLTVTQFVIAQFLVIATLIVGRQIHYSLNTDLGYKKDAIVSLRAPWNYYSDKEDNRRFTLLEKIKAIPEIEKVCLGGSTPASMGTSSSTVKINNGKDEAEVMVEMKYADSGYYDIYKMKIIAGRVPVPSDTTKEYLINETCLKAMGFSKPEDAIGKIADRSSRKIPIVGVIADFHTKSTHDPIKPLAFSSAVKNSFVFHIELRPHDAESDTWKTGLAKIEKAYKELYPEDDFNYEFFDETIAAFYKTEQNISRLLNWSAGLCIFISCLGLLGLVIYTTTQRTKEIGIRKVLGASVTQIVSLLSIDFINLVIIAFVIAAPVSWWAMHKWLEDFAYRTPVSWWIFVLSGAAMIIIALLTLSLQTIRSATANPVKSLRTE